jgi:hypothetical protein
MLIRITIDPKLLAGARARAAASGLTLGASRGGRLGAGVGLDDNAAVLERMERAEP